MSLTFRRAVYISVVSEYTLVEFSAFFLQKLLFQIRLCGKVRKKAYVQKSENRGQMTLSRKDLTQTQPQSFPPRRTTADHGVRVGQPFSPGRITAGRGVSAGGSSQHINGKWCGSDHVIGAEAVDDGNGGGPVHAELLHVGHKTVVSEGANGSRIAQVVHAALHE